MIQASSGRHQFGAAGYVPNDAVRGQREFVGGIRDRAEQQQASPEPRGQHSAQRGGDPTAVGGCGSTLR